MNDQPEKLDLRSWSVADEKREQLLRLFPEIRTEGDKVDFERLKLALGETVDVGKERYGMTWPGKAECFKTIQLPSLGTLRPCREESVNFDTSENLIIEGDNLEVLKLLQKSYLGRVKTIYIDPPYNTGNDFIYPDNYSESLQTYMEYTGQVDAQGKKFSTNTDTDGRFHSKWLNMMYPRLYLARNLLREDGLIFISIDDHEADNLRKLCSEVFGEENLIAWVANVNNPKGRSDDKYVATAHESLAIYKRTDARLGGWEPDGKVTRRYNKVATDGKPYREIDLRKTGDADRREDRPNMFYYFLFNEKTREFKVTRDEAVPAGCIQIRPVKDDGSDGRWRWGFDTAEEKLATLCPKFMPVRRMWGVFEKDVLADDERIKPTTVWAMKEVNSERGSEQFVELGFDKEVFPRPKPVGLIQRILDISSSDGDIVLDFFAGSGVVAQAIIEANAADGGNRHFILVQLPEPTRLPREDGTWTETAASKAGYKTIADVTKERVRRVINKLNGEESTTLPFQDGRKPDRGFRVFKLDESNFNPWDGGVAHEVTALESQLALNVEHIRQGRTDEDILYELLVKSGYPLTTTVEALELVGKKVHSVAAGALLICLERELTIDLLRAMADKRPERVVCLDEGFEGNDQLKANAAQIFKTKGVTSFKTV